MDKAGACKTLTSKIEDVLSQELGLLAVGDVELGRQVDDLQLNNRLFGGKRPTPTMA